MPARSFLLLICLLAVVGCGVQPVVGGTAGELRAGDLPLGDVQVTVHRATSDGTWQPIGFADTRSDGSFELVTPGAAGPLVLEPGEYRFTLESVGSPLRVPKPYLSAEATPLRIAWDGTLDRLRLELPRELGPR